MTKPSGLLLCSQVDIPARWPVGYFAFPSFPGDVPPHDLSSFCHYTLTSFNPKASFAPLHPKAGFCLLDSLAGLPELPTGAVAPMTPYSSSAVRVLKHQEISTVQFFFCLPSTLHPVWDKAGGAQQSHERSKSSSQQQRVCQTFLMLPSCCNSC